MSLTILQGNVANIYKKKTWMYPLSDNQWGRLGGEVESGGVCTLVNCAKYLGNESLLRVIFVNSEGSVMPLIGEIVLSVPLWTMMVSVSSLCLHMH